SDVGVITNIRPDHIGQDGIETLEDLVFIKSLIAERVCTGGTIVLNADDRELAGLMNLPRLEKVKDRRVVYFSLDPAHPLIASHRSTGGTVFFARGHELFEGTGEAESCLASTEAFPITIGGDADFQVSNILAAYAA